MIHIRRAKIAALMAWQPVEPIFRLPAIATISIDFAVGRAALLASGGIIAGMARAETVSCDHNRRQRPASSAMAI